MGPFEVAPGTQWDVGDDFERGMFPPKSVYSRWDTIPDSLRAHLDCPIVDELCPITQKHTIEGLVMGEA
jgi:hypothetical protein